ncbi:macrophage mannose receptor 1-like [Maniola jurtina]|uniref:macrophage mannose receptor 1-like n=1 Tax=Maniola jurtina TaxID=191418 RepID=UPI001E686CE7|nr:macrophage mannose receptor 1-like [Maniola jurtina]
MKVVTVCVIIPALFVAATHSKAVKEFRCDYEYVAEVDGWLKFHDIPASWFDARLRCHLEGTTLASPLNEDVQRAILCVAGRHDLFPRDIHTGIHATFSNGDFFSIEGVPLSDIKHEWVAGEPNNSNDDENCIYLTHSGTIGDANCGTPKPYVCYSKDDEDLAINECGTTDDGYKMDRASGSCYKFHGTPRVYSRAHMACAAEGGYLAIINGDSEADYIRKLFVQNPASSMVGPFYKEVAYLGFNDWNEHGEWLTIHGEPLEKAGYARWSAGEPNNLTGEFCGGVHRSGYLLDLKCDSVHAFICEKSLDSLLC